jgi:uncharacterized membrane protein
MISTGTVGKYLIIICWVGLLLWQPGWHALLPSPTGSNNWILALLTLAPLLLFSGTVLTLRQKPLAWGMFLVMLYFIVGVMEVWSNEAQRVPAAIQVILCCGFFAGLVLINRPGPLQPE